MRAPVLESILGALLTARAGLQPSTQGRRVSRLVLPGSPFEEVARITDLVSFYPQKVTITIDGEKLEPAPGQTVMSHGPDRNLSVDEIGGIELSEEAVPAEA